MDGLMISEKLANLSLRVPKKIGKPTSHYWPKKSGQDAVLGGLFWGQFYAEEIEKK